MVGSSKAIQAVFFRTAGGTEPVRDWLKDLPTEDRRAVGFDIATAEFGWPVGMPVCRSLGAGLWEVRTDLSDRRIARTIFCITSGRMILLHAFIKKTQQTPARELDLARKRMKEMER